MDQKRVLFIGADVADYLSIGVLNGLKSLDKFAVYDFPKSEILYNNFEDVLKPEIRGGGFTLFFLNEDVPVSRFHLSLINCRLIFLT